MNSRFLIVGLGSIGKRHLQCLRTIRPDADITVLRQHGRSKAIPEGADRVVLDLESALAYKPLAAIVANPANMHIDTAIDIANAGVHLLVEKPLSHSTERVSELLAICDQKQVVLMVAYVLRFNVGLIAFREALISGKIGRVLSFRAEVGQYLPDWRPGTDYRASVSARNALGGGALLELSHELDYIHWIFGKITGVYAQMVRSGTLEIDVEDVVEGILDIETERGHHCSGSFHLDMLQRAPYRICRAIGQQGTLEWDAIKGSVQWFDAGEQQWSLLYEADDLPRNATYIAQLEQFVTAINGKGINTISGRDGLKVLQLIDAIRKSSEQAKKVKLDADP
jgi:predicted dehydrogenase